MSRYLMIKINRLMWALRKAFLPVDSNALVLDVGSGGTPYPRSDILLDRLTGYEHRCGEAMMIDRQAVFGDAQKMPFKDKSFDFVVASHILEHMADPEKFLLELQRVGKAGYIETPNALFERLIPYHIHCLEVLNIDGVMHIHKKHAPVEDSYLGELQLIERDKKWSTLFFERLDMFHVRFFWDNTIDYKIHNPEVSCEWIESINAESDVGEQKDSYAAGDKGWRKTGLSLLNKWYAHKRKVRLADFQIEDILCCPDCHSDLKINDKKMSCLNCNASYSFAQFPDFTNTML